ncbi:MAG: tetratricopeptide repeat protein, partial [Candidatus Binataceae bacterium]
MAVRALEIHRKRPVLSVLAILLALLALAGSLAGPVAARTRKGDKFFALGKQQEIRKEWDKALELYQKALAEDPGDVGYQMAVDEMVFRAADGHVEKGRKLRKQGLLDEALVEFEHAYLIDPSSDIAQQEIQTTRQMIEREKKKGDVKSEDRGLTPSELSKKETTEKLASMLPMPELRPLNPQPINLKMVNQPGKVLFETVGKLAGINVLFDPEYTTPKPQSIELNGATLDEALDYVGLITKSFWKPLSANTIFVTQD